jgi:hypothetical protein
VCKRTAEEADLRNAQTFIAKLRIKCPQCAVTKSAAAIKPRTSKGWANISCTNCANTHHVKRWHCQCGRPWQLCGNHSTWPQAVAIVAKDLELQQRAITISRQPTNAGGMIKRTKRTKRPPTRNPFHFSCSSPLPHFPSHGIASQADRRKSKNSKGPSPALLARLTANHPKLSAVSDSVTG